MLARLRRLLFGLLCAAAAPLGAIAQPSVGALAQASSAKEIRELEREAGALAAAGDDSRAATLYESAIRLRERDPGAEPLDLARTLNALGIAYWRMSSYRRAESALGRALRIREQRQGAGHPDTAQSQDLLATVLLDMQVYDRAEALYLSALATRERALGPDAIATASTINNLADLYTATGDRAKAGPLYERSLAIHEQALGPDHLDTARVLNNLAEFHRRSGDFAKVEALHLRVLAIRERQLGPRHPDTARTLHNLAGVYLETGDYAKAEPLYLRALAVEEAALGPVHAYTAQTAANLAELYMRTGAVDRAEPLYRRSLDGVEQVFGQDHRRTAEAVWSLANFYARSRNYEKAEPLRRRLIAILEKTYGPDSQATASGLADLAQLYSDTGAYALALTAYQRAYENARRSLGERHRATVSNLGNVGHAYLQLGMNEQAEIHLKQALSASESVFGADDPATVTVLSNLAVLYVNTGAYAQAEALHRRALAVRERVHGPDSTLTARSLANLGALYGYMGRDEAGESMQRRALAIRDKALGPDHPETAATLSNLAAIDWANGRWSRAAEELRRWAAAEESTWARVLAVGNESRKRAYIARRSGHVDAAITFALMAQDKVDDAASLGLNIVLQRKGRVLDVLADSYESLRRSAAAQDRELLDAWRDANGRYATLLFADPATSPERRRQLDRLREAANSLEARMSEHGTALLRQHQDISVERVQRALPARAVLIEWFRYQPTIPLQSGRLEQRPARYVAYVLKSAGPPVAIDVGDASVVERAVAELLAALRDPRSTIVDPLARELDRRLIEPLRTSLQGADQLLISPDGVLSLLPFAVLVGPDGRGLIESSPITYLTSGRDLLRAPPGRAEPRRTVVIAAPDFGAAGTPDARPPANGRRSSDMVGMRFSALPGTLEEAVAIKSTLGLGDAQVLTGVDASEGAVKQLDRPFILHIATHGFFLADRVTDDERSAIAQPDEPALRSIADDALLRSGLALAGANQRVSGREDGVLTALEVSGLDLAGTELAVLSACDTGVGRIDNGEGVFGLRRALVLAGVRTQITSLWKVDDKATTELMVDYYSRLKRGAGRSQAMRDAQLAMRRHVQRSHPAYWAAFIVIGDGSPLPR